MSGRGLQRACFVAAIAILGAGVAFSADYPAPEGEGNGAVMTKTLASDDVVLSFVRPGRIEKILVKVGDRVEAGQLLAQQESSEEQAEYDFAKAQADDDTRTEAQVKICAQKGKVLERKKLAGDTVNATELDEAQLDYEVAVAQTALAKFEHTQDGIKFAQAAAVLEKTKILSPVNGVVQQLFVQQGESVDSQSMKVMRVVNVDPLWIDAPVPFVKAAKIKVNDVAHVVFTDDQRTAEGVVLAVAPVGQSDSGTRYVRLAVKNEMKRPGGERVTVTFDTDKVADLQKP